MQKDFVEDRGLLLLHVYVIITFTEMCGPTLQPRPRARSFKLVLETVSHGRCQHDNSSMEYKNYSALKCHNALIFD